MDGGGCGRGVGHLQGAARGVAGRGRARAAAPCCARRHASQPGDALALHPIPPSPSPPPPPDATTFEAVKSNAYAILASLGPHMEQPQLDQLFARLKVRCSAVQAAGCRLHGAARCSAVKLQAAGSGSRARALVASLSRAAAAALRRRPCRGSAVPLTRAAAALGRPRPLHRRRAPPPAV